MDLTIEGKAWIQGSFKQCCIGITQGKISEIKKILKGDEHIDVGHQVILPSGIDVHVHFRDPGFPHKDDFYTGSLAAAFGGITCVGDMPNTQPATISKQTLVDKQEIAQKKSVVDFGLYAGITNQNWEQASDLSSFCTGWKIYLGSSTNALLLQMEHLADALSAFQSTKKPVFVHAEDESCLQKHSFNSMNLHDHLRSRPSQCEEYALSRILRIAKEVTTPIHICHLSSAEGAELMRHRPSHVTVGCTPHHVLCDVDHVTGPDQWWKVNPPIRSSFDRQNLWQAISEGVIDVMESDHAPHSLQEKEKTFADAPCGIPGVETMYPLLLGLVHQNHITMERVMQLICQHPARLLGIPKGSIAVGHDADLVVVDLQHPEKITAESLHSNCGWTPYEGRKGVFPSMVFLRGKTLIADGELLQKPGCGQYIGG